MKILKDKRMSYLALLKWMVLNLEVGYLHANICNCTFYTTETFRPTDYIVIDGESTKLLGIEIGEGKVINCNFL